MKQKKKKGGKPSIENQCAWLVKDVRCQAPRLKDGIYCRHHPPLDQRYPSLPSAVGSGGFDLTLETYDDVVRWKREITIKRQTGGMTAEKAEGLEKLLTSLANSMKLRDQMDPDKESQRQFSIEAAIAAAKKMGTKQAMDLLRSGSTNFLAFLQNPVVEGAQIVEAEVTVADEQNTEAVELPEKAGEKPPAPRNLQEFMDQLKQR